MNEEPLDLRRILSVLKKGWLVLLALLSVGMVAGFLLGSREPTYVARSLVLLPPSPVNAQGKQARNIATEVNIAGNGNILQQAGRAVDPPLGVQQMRKRIRVVGLTADILEVRAQARTARSAALLADAVAKEYVAQATDASSSVATTSISALQGEAARLEQQLGGLSADLNESTARLNVLAPDSPERLRLAAIIDSLRLEETETARQLASLKTRVAEAQLLDRLNRLGTRLLAPAITPSRPSGAPPIVLTAGGAALGLVAGAILLLIRDRRDGRLRRRSDIAIVVAAPILASLPAPRRTSQRRCLALLEQWEPMPVVSWAIRQAFVHLEIGVQEPPCHLVVLGLPGDAAAPHVALQLAVMGASAGLRTAIVVSTSHPTAAPLRSACNAGLGRSETRPCLSAHVELADEEEHDELRLAQLVISFVIAGSDPVGEVQPGFRTITTLAVSSGRATADELATTALACLDAGQPLVGVFLANPDPSDQTSGDLVRGARARPVRPAEQPSLGRPAVAEIGAADDNGAWCPEDGPVGAQGSARDADVTEVNEEQEILKGKAAALFQKARAEIEAKNPRSEAPTGSHVKQVGGNGNRTTNGNRFPDDDGSGSQGGLGETPTTWVADPS